MPTVNTPTSPNISHDQARRCVLHDIGQMQQAGHANMLTDMSRMRPTCASSSSPLTCGKRVIQPGNNSAPWVHNQRVPIADALLVVLPCLQQEKRVSVMLASDI